MKKLLTAVAVAALVGVTNAASFSWGFTSIDILDPSGNYIEGGTASLYIGDTLIATGGQNGDYTFGVFDNTAGDQSGKVQSLGRGDIASSFAGQAYKLVLSYTDTDGAEWEYSYSGTSSYTEIAGAPGEDSYNYETFMTDYAIQAGDWSAVPEPTSGLLMLIGMAGLALRRRRA